jgi:hypothetical protein
MSQPTLFRYQECAIEEMKVFEKNCNYTRAVVVGNPGVGKSITVCAHILQNNIDIKNRWLYSSIQVQGNWYTVKKFFNVCKPVNLIIVAPVNLKQWENYINLFNISVFVIKDCKTLNLFYEHIEKNTIINYKIVLIKNGTISGKINFDSFNDKKTKHIVTCIAEISQKFCFYRVFYDDPDFVGLPRDFTFINAYFSWFVSATNKKIQSNKCVNNGPLEYIFESLDNTENHNILKDLIESKMAVFINDNKEINNIITPEMYSYPIVNEHKSKIEIINNLSGNNNLVSMLNGGAISTAAKYLGIEGKSIEDVLSKIMIDSKQTMYELKEYLSFLTSEENSEEEINKLPVTLKETNVTDLRKLIPIIENHKSTTYNLILSEIKKTKESLTKLENVFNRVKNGINEGCPVCLESFEEISFIIVKCCGKSICSTCFAQATNIKASNSNITGKCPCCRGEIVMKNNTIFVEKELKQSILVCDATKVEIPSVQPPEIKSKSTKLSVLIEILKDNITHERKNVPLLNGILLGNSNIENEHKSIPKKFLIFVKFDEGIEKVKEELKKNNLEFVVLMGRIEVMDKIIYDFQNTDKINILIIHTLYYSSGINLQSTSDLIIIDNLCDAEMIQCIGRAQRIGRKGKLTIHSLDYI